MKKTAIRIIFFLFFVVLLAVTIIFTNDTVNAQFHTKRLMPIVGIAIWINVVATLIWVRKENKR